MNPQDPLAALKPLREPELVGWWPPAPGWWILFFTLLAAVLVMLWWLRRRHRARAYRRNALSQLATLDPAATTREQRRDYLIAANALLKSVAITVFPPSRVAAANGSQWSEFLNNSMRGDQAFPEDFASAAYRPDCPEVDLQQVHLASQNWIMTHEVPR